MATIQPQITPSAANWDIGRKMFDILEDLLNPSTALSPSEAAQRIKSLHHEYHSPVTDTGRFLFEFWDLLFKIAAQLPHDGQQQRILINFIDDLRKIHTEHEHEGHKLWGDLPDHGMYGWEAFNDIVEDTPEEMNFIAFLALLTKENISNWSDFALHEFRNTLENEPDPRSRAYHQQGPALDLRIPYVLLWLSVAGEKLFSCVVKGVGTLGESRLWKGQLREVCVERWQLWKRRFGEISRLDQASEETGELARKAEYLMGIVEGGMMIE